MQYRKELSFMIPMAHIQPHTVLSECKGQAEANLSEPGSLLSSKHGAACHVIIWEG